MTNSGGISNEQKLAWPFKVLSSLLLAIPIFSSKTTCHLITASCAQISTRDYTTSPYWPYQINYFQEDIKACLQEEVPPNAIMAISLRGVLPQLPGHWPVIVPQSLHCEKNILDCEYSENANLMNDALCISLPSSSSASKASTRYGRYFTPCSLFELRILASRFPSIFQPRDLRRPLWASSWGNSGVGADSDPDLLSSLAIVVKRTTSFDYYLSSLCTGTLYRARKV